MNLTEKILAAHTDRKDVTPGEFINARVDMIVSNDITAPIAINEFRKLGVDKVFDKLASRYCERPGGYTRITKLGPRLGDGAAMVQLELVE